MIHVSIFEQELFGAMHFRVVRDDGLRIFDRLQTDFPSEAEAVAAVSGEARRNKLGQVKVKIYLLDRQAGGRRIPAKTVLLEHQS